MECDIPIFPTWDRVVVLPLEEDNKVTKAGFIIKNESKVSRGMIVAKSLQVKSVEKGDEVLYRTGAGDEVELGDKTYFIMREESIQAKLI